MTVAVWLVGESKALYRGVVFPARKIARERESFAFLIRSLLRTKDGVVVNGLQKNQSSTIEGSTSSVEMIKYECDVMNPREVSIPLGRRRE